MRETVRQRWRDSKTERQRNKNKRREEDGATMGVAIKIICVRSFRNGLHDFAASDRKLVCIKGEFGYSNLG